MIDELVVIPQEKSPLSDLHKISAFSKEWRANLKVLRGKAFANLEREVRATERNSQDTGSYKLEKDFTDK